MEEESIETLVHPAGNVAPFSHKNDYMGYKLNPIEYEEATLGLQATEDRKVIRGNDERKDSPEDRETNGDKHIKIKEMNEKRGERMNNDEEKDGNNDSSERNIIKEMDEESIEITESAPSSQNIYCLEYEHVQMKHEGANLELYVNEDKTYIGDNVEKHDSPET